MPQDKTDERDSDQSQQLGQAPTMPAATDPLRPVTARFAADMAAPTRFGADKFDVEARLIDLGGALAAAQELFKALERDFYRAAFGRYDE